VDGGRAYHEWKQRRTPPWLIWTLALVVIAIIVVLIVR
jgi:hypothetical protein